MSASLNTAVVPVPWTILVPIPTVPTVPTVPLELLWLCEFLGLGTIKLGGSYTILAVIRPLCRKAQNAAAHWPRPGHARNSSSDSDSEWPGVRIKFSGKLEAQLGLILRRVILIFTRVKGSSLGRQEIGPGVIGNLLLSRGLFFTKSLNDHWRLSPKPPELAGFYVICVRATE